jgi:two-component system alkaline phosphatase synthesis response regulator PhoP
MSSEGVFLLEDEPQLARVLVLSLEKMNLKAIHASSLQGARELLETRDFSRWPRLFLVDRNLPDGDGLELVDEIRKKGFDGAVLVLSARGSSKDKVVGLDQGADDYLAKPFDFDELAARIRSLSKRITIHENLWFLDDDQRRILGPKGWVVLTPIEFKLCQAVMSQPEKIISRDELLKNVWGYQFLPKTRTVDFFWGRLRKLFELDPENPKHFLTVRGSGYRFVK